MSLRAVIAASLALLSRRDRRRLLVATAAQMSTAVLDLAGVLLVGIVIALASSATTGAATAAPISKLEDIFGGNAKNTESLALTLALVAALLLISKSAINAYLTRRILKFLARRQADVSARLTSELLSQPLLYVQKRSSHETAYALTTGVNYVTLIILGQSVVAVTEFALLVVLALGLLFVSPWVTVFAILFFAAIALLLQRLLSGWAGRLGDEASETQIASYELVQEALRTYREVVVSHRRQHYVARFTDLRWHTAMLQADLQVVALIPKYVLEVALVLGAGALAFAELQTQSRTAALATIAVFLAAGSRIVPSILRLQVAALSIKTAVGQAEPTLMLATELGLDMSPTTEKRDSQAVAAASAVTVAPSAKAFVPSVKIVGAYFTYPGASEATLRDVSLDVPAGASIAFVGSTGAGKSTLADVVLGVLRVDEGTVECGGLPPHDAVALWPGAFAYVPQDVALINGTVRSNVALGYAPTEIDTAKVWTALKRARLAAFLQEQREGLDTEIGENGIRLSGGQRQRLGIARALYSEPRLLVLDEATSALDAETERAISETLHDLRGTVTTITIAHRLATVVDCDEIVYLENGAVAARGTFQQLMNNSERFRTQAELLGLGPSITPTADSESEKS